MEKRQFKVVSASGILGYGFPADSLRRAMERKPDMLGCDGGSTDPGAYYLGSGNAFVARESCKRDFRMLLLAAREADIPLVLGSSGGAGGRENVKFLVDIAKEVAKEENIHFKLAVINCETEKDYLKEKLSAGKITPLGYFPELTETEIDRAAHTVRLMGVASVQKAVELGAQVVIAGRISDTALFAALPLTKGFNPGLVWHASKILECGASSCEPSRANDCIMATIEDDCFYIEPMNPELRHTKMSVAAHSLYENSSPFHYKEPSGTLDITGSKFEQYTDRCVKVTGSVLIPSEKYTEKLESAAPIGYRTISIMGVRDPILVSTIDEYEQIVRDDVARKVKEAYYGEVTEKDYDFRFHVFGRNAVMGKMEPVKEIRGHELGIVLEVVAADYDLSATVLAFARTSTLHNHFPNRKCIAGNMAVTYSPSDIKMGMAYEFNMNHVLELDDPLEAIDIELCDL